MLLVSIPQIPKLKSLICHSFWRLAKSRRGAYQDDGPQTKIQNTPVATADVLQTTRQTVSCTRKKILTEYSCCQTVSSSI